MQVGPRESKHWHTPKAGMADTKTIPSTEQMRTADTSSGRQTRTFYSAVLVITTGRPDPILRGVWVTDAEYLEKKC